MVIERAALDLIDNIHITRVNLLCYCFLCAKTCRILKGRKKPKQSRKEFHKNRNSSENTAIGKVSRKYSERDFATNEGFRCERAVSEAAISVLKRPLTLEAMSVLNWKILFTG